MNLATSTTNPRHGLMPLNPFSPGTSSLRRSLFAYSLRKISPMASAPASAALSTAADNGAAKPAEKQPVQVGITSTPGSRCPLAI